MEYPNGTTGIVGSYLWESVRLSHPEVFFIDSDIEIVIQTEGKYAGDSVIKVLSSYSQNEIGEIQHVYIGLPTHIIEKILWVDEEFRTNPLSKTLGGCDVIIEYKDGKILGYDKIKFPSIYVDKIINDYFGTITDFEKLNRDKKLEIIKIYISRVFAKSYKDDNEYMIKPFEEIWAASKHNNFPTEALIDFEGANNYDFTF